MTGVTFVPVHSGKSRLFAVPFVRDLATSNRVPTDGEAAEIRQMLAATRAQYHAVDSVGGPDPRDGMWLELIRSYEGILSVVRRIPYDVLLRIFVFLEPEGTMLWRLQLVSRDWRDAGFSPGLWGCLGLVDPRTLLERLQRSAGVPLQFRLETGDLSTNALIALCKECKRWKVASFNLDDYLYSKMGALTLQGNRRMSRVTTQFPLLESLDVSIGSRCSRSEPDNLFEKAPILRTVRLCKMLITRFVLPWANLRSLYLRKVGRGDRLVVIAVPNMQDLTFSGCRGMRLWSCMDSMGALEKLAFVSMEVDLMILSGRSLPRLTSLSLHCVTPARVSEDDAMLLFERLPTLVHLSLDDTLCTLENGSLKATIGRRTFARMTLDTPKSDTPPLLPNLESLVLYPVNPTDFGCLLNMIESRFAGECGGCGDGGKYRTLRRADVRETEQGNRNVRGPYLRRLEALRERGLDMSRVDYDSVYS